MQIVGTFLLIGADIEPQVHVLSVGAHEAFQQGLAVASKYENDGSSKLRDEVYRSTFGVRCQYAVPAWSREAMTAIATQYAGPHAERVKQLAACLALGKPYGVDEPRDQKPGDGKGPRGGQKAKLVPEKPRRPPGGNAVDLMFSNAGGAR